MKEHANRRIPWWWLPAFFVAAFIVFWPVLSFTPFSDDHSALWNSGVRGIPWRNGFFRPLSDLTFRVGYWLFGTSTWAHHAFNIGVHALNTFFLFVFCRQWFGRTGALVAAALFLVYPFHQESIVWLVGRESALGTSAVLVGLVIAGSGLPIFLRLLTMAMCVMLGSLCYESALLLLPLSLVIAWSRVIPQWPPVRSIAIVLGLAAVVYLILRLNSVDGGGGYAQDLLPKDALDSLIRVPKALARLLLPPEPDVQKQMLRVGLLLAALIMLGFFSLRSKTFAPVRGAILLCVLLMLLASSIAMVAGVSTITSESDRFLYLPSAFLCALGGITLSRLQTRFFRWGSFAVLLLLGLWQTKLNHANWSQASSITAQCLTNLPAIPHGAKLWVQDLPQEVAGAFILRNGFPEAVDLAGKDGSRVVVVPIGTSQADALTNGLTYRGRSITMEPGDRWCRWDGGRYVVVR